MIIIEFKSYKGGDGKSTGAYAFSKVLKNAELVDLDHQKTITRAAELTKSKMPVEAHVAKGKYLIFDTPPYRQDNGLDVSEKADYIIIPAKATYNSLLSMEELYNDLVKKKLLKKAWLFFNEVRKPVDTTHKEVIDLFKQNFKGLKIAETCWSNLKSFKEILRKPLDKKAWEQVNQLIEELKIIKRV